MYIIVLTTIFAYGATCLDTTLYKTNPAVHAVPKPADYPTATDLSMYNQYKKSLYSLITGMCGVCFSSQNGFDYYKLYKALGNAQLPKLNEKMNKLTNSNLYVDQLYKAYQNEYLNFNKYLSSAYPDMKPIINDDIAIRDVIFNNK